MQLTKLKDFNRHIIRKAINVQAKKESSILRFNRLKGELAISSIEDIIGDDFFGEFPISLKAPKNCKSLQDIDEKTQVNALINFFGKICIELKSISNPNIGSDFEPVGFKDYVWSKVKSVINDPENEYLHNELVSKGWYVLNRFDGTSEERNLIQFIKDFMGNFETHYEEVYLLRNEEIYEIFDFERGRRFMPDFLLFLKEKKKNQFYQIFIEPKGSQFKDAEGGFHESKEGWKEDFLKQITDKYGKNQILQLQNKNYKLIGLPLFNQKTSKVFKDAVKDNLTVEL